MSTLIDIWYRLVFQSTRFREGATMSPHANMVRMRRFKVVG